MYSVIRFTLPKDRASELEPIGARMNEREAGVFEGLRRAGDGFACELGRFATWEAHLEAAAEFIEIHEDSIREAVAIGARVTFDVALGEEDRRPSAVALSLSSSPRLLRVFADANVWLEASFY